GLWRLVVESRQRPRLGQHALEWIQRVPQLRRIPWRWRVQWIPRRRAALVSATVRRPMTAAAGGTNMSHLPGLNKIPVVRVAVCSVLIVMLISAGACRRKPDNNTAVGTTGEETQKTFASPAEAGAALHDAAKSGDQGALAPVFG